MTRIDLHQLRSTADHKRLKRSLTHSCRTFRTPFTLPAVRRSSLLVIELADEGFETSLAFPAIFLNIIQVISLKLFVSVYQAAIATKRSDITLLSAAFAAP